MLSIKLFILSSFINTSSPSLIMTNKNDTSVNSSNKFLISNTSDIHKIGIVDFRYILKKSNAMKNLGNKFLLFEKKINENFKLKQIDLKKKEILIKKDKVNLTELEYKKKMKL